MLLIASVGLRRARLTTERSAVIREIREIVVHPLGFSKSAWPNGDDDFNGSDLLNGGDTHHRFSTTLTP
jgi:hypothetical protein